MKKYFVEIIADFQFSSSRFLVLNHQELIRNSGKMLIFFGFKWKLPFFFTRTRQIQGISWWTALGREKQGLWQLELRGWGGTEPCGSISNGGGFSWGDLCVTVNTDKPKCTSSQGKFLSISGISSVPGLRHKRNPGVSFRRSDPHGTRLWNLPILQEK